MAKIRYILLFFCALATLQCVQFSPDGNPEYLPLDDSEYPYANLPRLVIETENFREIRDKETKIPAKLQIYGKSAPESEVLDLTVKGRGNSSFVMTKYSIKLDFDSKISLFGMPKNKDWNLISNFRDKSHLRNFITFQLAELLGGDYVPRSTFVEVFFNRKYLGLYLLTESVKVGKERVNISQTDSSFLIEKTTRQNAKGPLFTTNRKYLFRIRYPKEPSAASIHLVQNHLNAFEQYLADSSFSKNNPLEKWIDVENFIRYYWIHELAKNKDGAFERSVFATWEKGGIIRMGPIWDFDLAYGLWNEEKSPPSEWHIAKSGWTGLLMGHESYRLLVKSYWKNHREKFQSILQFIEQDVPIIAKAVQNDEKRWPILENDETWPFVDSYPDYPSAVDSLKSWISKRLAWIDENL